jgi:hypothetical protein
MPDRSHRRAAAAALALLLAGCTTERVTQPARTATEQLLISTAADRAAHKLALDVPHNSRVYVDASNFEATDGKYALSAIKAELLRRGALLVTDQKKADIIVEPRSGALSIDESTAIVGIPQFDIPIPAAGNLTFPEIALFKKEEKQGIAKFAAIGYDAKTGQLVAASDPDYGFSHKTQWVVALFISWNTNDLIPEEAEVPADRYFFGEHLPIGKQDSPFNQWK